MFKAATVENLAFNCNYELDFQAHKVIDHELLQEFLDIYFNTEVKFTNKLNDDIPQFTLFVNFIVCKYYYNETNYGKNFLPQKNYTSFQEKILKYIGRKYYELERILTKQETIDIIGKFYLLETNQ